VKKTTMISVFVVLGILTVGCGVTWAQVKTPVTYWYFSVTDEQHAFLQTVISAFNAENPYVKVEGQRMSGSMYDKTLTAIVGGAPPDVLHFERSAVVEWVASKGEIFEPLDAYLARELQEPRRLSPDGPDRDCLSGTRHGLRPLALTYAACSGTMRCLAGSRCRLQPRSKEV
jgi:ABC-type glycerol-3-phosphate transport system substrate-binding protein